MPSAEYRRKQAQLCRPASFLCLTAFLLATSSAGTADAIPIPRARPAIAPSPCRLQLAERAVFEPLPPITGPGECAATDVVEVDAVLLQDKHRVAFSPPVTLRCPMADAVAQWISNDVAPTIAALGTSLRSVESLDSFDCRPRNGIAGAQISEHGRANALDMRSFKLENGKIIELNDNAGVAEPLRERLRDSACGRFSTVLGNGADAYHNGHVHVDLMARSNHYKICQWDVREQTETGALVAKKTAAAAHIPAETRHAEEQPVTAGPWTIAVSYKSDKFDSCSMSRSATELGVTFLRSADGLLLVLESQKWKLERGKAYAVRLVAGSRSVEAKALAESKAVRIALVDRGLNERLRNASVLEVRGEGETLRVPLDGSTMALGRLEECFDKNSRAGVETNPFVAPGRKP